MYVGWEDIDLLTTFKIDLYCLAVEIPFLEYMLFHEDFF